MSKKSRFRGPFHKQHGKHDKKLLKSERHHLQQIYLSLRRQLSWKKSFLVICKVLKLFVNTLTANDKYSFLNRHNLTQPIQMQLSQKNKDFYQSFSAFSKFALNFEYLQTKKTIIADVFPKSQTQKNLVK